MPKPVKIKRYKRTYRQYHSPGAIFLRTVGVIAAVCILGFIGWSAYGPVMDFLTGVPLEKPVKNASSSEVQAVSSEAAATPAPAPAPEPVMPKQLRAVYAPVSALASAETLDRFLTGVQGYEPNAVVFDLKDSKGNILYRSKLEQVNKVGSQATGAYDLEKLCDLLEERELAPIGWMQAFRDPVAPSKLTDSGVTYMNSEMLWLDNAKDAGGKPWLNPYAPSARDYLKAIALEASSMGVRQILLDNLNFPIAFGGLEFATYGEQANTLGRAEALSGFAQELRTALEAQKTSLSVYVTGLSALGMNDVYFGGSPFDVSGENVTLGVQPAQFGDRFVLDNFTAEAPILNPGKTVSTLTQSLSADLTGKQVTGLIQGYTDARTTLVNNSVYSAEDIKVQITALAQSGIASYIIYSPDGNYPPAA